MHAQLLVVGLAAVASASNVVALQPRATDSLSGLSSACESAALSLISDLPTPPSKLESDLADHPQTNPCSFSGPASLKSEYASYSSELVSWYSAHESEVSTALSKCSDLTSLVTSLPVCSTAVTAVLGGTTMATPTTSAGSGGATPGASTTTASGNGAARETGMVMAAAAAVAGFAAIM